MKYIGGYKVRSDATLLSWSKRDLVDLVRVLENNFQNEYERNKRVYALLVRHNFFCKPEGNMIPEQSKMLSEELTEEYFGGEDKKAANSDED